MGGDVGEVFGEGGVVLPCLTTSQDVVVWLGVLMQFLRYLLLDLLDKAQQHS